MASIIRPRSRSLRHSNQRSRGQFTSMFQRKRTSSSHELVWSTRSSTESRYWRWLAMTTSCRSV